MIAWKRGYAALYVGEWPCHVVTVDAPRQRAMIAFLGGDSPQGVKAEAIVALDTLTRPRFPAQIDRLAMRHWSSKTNRWTGTELRRLRDEVRLREVAEVAAGLGRSQKACEIALYRWWGSKAPSSDLRMTSRRVARIMGWDDHRVTSLIAEGALAAAKSGVRAGKNCRWTITDTSLDDFLVRCPERYDWRQIEPGRWRDRAEAINQSDPLVDVDEAAARLFVTREVVLRHIQRGWLAAVWSDGGKANSSRRWLIRTSVLAGFVCKPGLVAWKAARDRELARRGLLSVAAAAAALGCGQDAVVHRAKAGRLHKERLRIGGRWAIGVFLPRSDARSGWSRADSDEVAA